MTASSVLERACVQAMIECYGNTEDLDALPAPAFSPAFEQKMKRLSAHVRDDRYHTFTRGVQVLLIAAILLLLASLSVVAARQFGFSLIDLGYKSELDMEKRTAYINDPLVCDYIPVGFRLVETYHDPTFVSYSYKGNDNAFIEIAKYASYSRYGLDTESRAPTEVENNGIRYTIAGSNEAPVIIWMDPDTECLYEVCGNISEEELLKIAYETK